MYRVMGVEGFGMRTLDIYHMYFQLQYYGSWLYTSTTQSDTHTKAALVSSVLISLCRSPIAPHACVTLCRGDGERDTLS